MDEVAEWLGERTGQTWRVERLSDPVSATANEADEVLDELQEHRRNREWRYAVCVTDLPLTVGERPIVAERDIERGVAVISLPALGLPLKSRLRRLLTTLFAEMLGEPDIAGRGPGGVRETRTGAGDTEARYTVRPVLGWVRLVFGMVRANRPWRLVFGLSSALAAALATSAFGLSSTTIWEVADRLAPWRRVVAAVISVAVLVFWLIAAHRLWERKKHGDRVSPRLLVLYNLSTLATLTIGTAVMYVGLFLVNLGVASFLLSRSLVESSLSHPAGATTYVAVAWGFTTLGMLAGAVGSSLESDQAVRQAAYGYRERQRRQQREKQRREHQETERRDSTSE